MFKEFIDGVTQRRVMVQYDHVYLLNESQNGAAQVISVGGAAVQTGIPYAELRAWLNEVDKELSESEPT